MSYCRFSTDNHQCDAYVYEAESGITIHMAAKRYVFSEPLPARPPNEDIPAQLAWHKVMSKIRDSSDMAPIGLPHDGASWYGLAHEDAANHLESLRDIGYRIPLYVIGALREEAE